MPTDFARMLPDGSGAKVIRNPPTSGALLMTRDTSARVGKELEQE
jgi:hypothetical protein